MGRFAHEAAVANEPVVGQKLEQLEQERARLAAAAAVALFRVLARRGEGTAEVSP